ncbi:MAG: 23S rRNA pseudouridine(1911/1915/1917) synthase RluD [Gammaproteobacteria bacterium]
MNETLTATHDVTIAPDLDGMRLDRALARVLPQYSRAAIKQWIEAGAATLNGATVRPRTAVRADDRVHLEASFAPVPGLRAQAVGFEVVHADDELVVVDKPAGLVVHPGAGNPDHTLVNGLIERFPEMAALPRAGLVHRIDKDTSGLLLAARRPQSFQALVRAMAAREIHRSYLAVVNGVLVAGGTIEEPIGRDPRQRTRMSVRAGGRPAVTHFRVLQRFRAHSLLDVKLETGRTHQIRVHLAARGHPLVGDTRYGGRPRPPKGADERLLETLSRFPRQALHAARLSFEHPTSGQALDFESAPPADFTALVDALEADRHSHGAAP